MEELETSGQLDSDSSTPSESIEFEFVESVGIESDVSESVVYESVEQENEVEIKTENIAIQSTETFENLVDEFVESSFPSTESIESESTETIESNDSYVSDCENLLDEFASVENETQYDSSTSSDVVQQEENESVSIVTETVTEYVSTYTEEQHAEILQRLDNIHTAIQYGDCLIIVFILVMICSYSYKFLNMFFTGRKGSW